MIRQTDRVFAPFKQQLAGKSFTENEGDLAGQPCVTATPLDLAEWIAGNTQAMFDPADTIEFVREQ